LRKLDTPRITLCQCDCHLRCAIALDEDIPENTWCELCHCPGAEESKPWHWAWSEERATRKRTTKEISASIDTTSGKSRAELRTELEIAYQQRGITPEPYELDAIS